MKENVGKYLGGFAGNCSSEIPQFRASDYISILTARLECLERLVQTLQTLQAQLAYLGRRANPGSKTNSGDVAGDIAGEYQALMEQEYFDFVLFEVPWIVL